MITEDYVSFEVAKLLKEKGYKGSFNGYYNNAGCVVDKPNTILKEPKYQYYERVSLQMAMKWLREIHNISIEVVYDCSNDKPKTISWWLAYIKHINSDSSKGSDCLTAYDSYEEAADDAIKYVLENWI